MRGIFSLHEAEQSWIMNIWAKYISFLFIFYSRFFLFFTSYDVKKREQKIKMN